MGKKIGRGLSVEQVPEEVPVSEFITEPVMRSQVADEPLNKSAEGIRVEEPTVISHVTQAKTGEFVFAGDDAPQMPSEGPGAESTPVFSEEIPSYEIPSAEMPSGEIPFEEKEFAKPEEEITCIDDIQFPDEMMQQSQPAGSQVVIDDLQDMPADEPAPAETARAWQEPLFEEFAQPESRVHMPQSQPARQQPQMPEQPAMPQSQPAYQQPQVQEQPQVQQKPSKNRMTFDTAKSGRTYDKSEIESIIKN